MVDLMIVHGCCKAENPERNSRAKIEAENAAAVRPLEGSYDDVYTAYYTCTLNHEVRRLGHQLDGERFPLPGDCEPAPEIAGPPQHDDLADWLAALDRGMATLVGKDLAEADPDEPETQEGWADVHTYLHPHEHGSLGPETPFREPVWDAVAADTPAEPYVLIGHSLGSVIAADMIREGLLRPDALVTIGSPLTIPLINESIERFTFDGPWLNLYHPADGATAFGKLSPFDAGFAGSPDAHLPVERPGADAHGLVAYLEGAADQIRELLESSGLPD